MLLDDFVSAEDIVAVNRPTGEARGLPPAVYGSAFYELEKRELFPRQWCAVGFETDIPSPGDAVSVDLAGWQIMLLRGAKGEVQAFHNVCRHRGVQLVEGRCTGQKFIACPWHGWIYGLDGKLLKTPRIGGGRGHEDPRFDPTGLDLKKMSVGTWMGMIFVNMDNSAAPLEEHLKGLRSIVERDYDFSEAEVAEAWETAYPGNWKITVEGAIEDYHLPLCHPELVRGAIEANLQLNLLHEPERYFLAASRRTYQDPKSGGEAVGTSSDLPSFERTPGGAGYVYFMSVFPSAFIVIRPNHVVTGVVLPDGHKKTRLDFRYLYKGSAAHDEKFAATRAALAAQWEMVFNQDIAYVESLQRNSDQPGDSGIRPRFSPFWETNVVHFQQTVVQALSHTRADSQKYSEAAE